MKLYYKGFTHRYIYCKPTKIIPQLTAGTKGQQWTSITLVVDEKPVEIWYDTLYAVNCYFTYADRWFAFNRSEMDPAKITTLPELVSLT